jgi:hypothetical protein
MKKIQTLVVIVVILLSKNLKAQFVYPNEDCSSAIPLPVNPSTEFIDFIDQDGGLADPATSALAACGIGIAKNDLWYTFTAVHTDHFIRIVGEALNIELFSGTCGALTSINCATLKTAVDYSGLTIGQTYYVRTFINPSVSNGGNIASHLYLLSPPTNDDCNNATLLSVNPPDFPRKTTRLFNTKLATPSALPCINGPANFRDLWFKFVATSVSNTVYWTSVGADVKIYSGSPGSFITLASSVGAVTESKTLNNLVIGQTYYIRVSNTSPSTSDISIFLGISDRPSNDECMNADTVQMSSSIDCENSFMNSSLGASASLMPCASNTLNDAWYVFKATATDVLITHASLSSVRFSLLSGTCNALTCLVSNTANVLTYNGLTIGNYYYLRIDEDEQISVCISPFITNDDCSGAITLPVAPFGSKASKKGTNYTATQSLPKCNGGSGQDIWYQFTAVDTACFIDVKANIPGCEYNLMTGTCANPSSITCLPANVKHRMSNLIIGNSYFIRCYSNSPNSIFSIQVSGLPANDVCANAKTIIVQNNLDYLDPTMNGLLEASTSLPPCSTSTFTKDVWYQFTASNTTAAIISHTIPNNSNAFYQVYSGNCTVLNSISCFSHSITELHKAITLTGLIPNQNYYIRQYGNKFVTSLSVVNPPLNDLISGAIQLTPTPSSVQKFPSYSLHGASKSFGRICTNLSGVPQHDVWFYFIAQNSTHNVSISSFNSFWNEQNTGITYRMEAFKGYAADSLGLSIKKLPCTSTPFILNGLTTGDTIYLRVYNTSPLGTTTIFSIKVNNNQSIDEPLGALKLDEINDYQYQLSTSGATQTLPPANCKTIEYSDDDVWLKFTHTTTSKRIIAGYEDKDIVLELFSGTPGSLTSLFCSNNIMVLPNNLSVGVQYYVRAYSKANAQAATFRIGLFNDGNALSNICVNPSLLGPNLVKNPKCESDYNLLPAISVAGPFMPGSPLAKDWCSTINTTADIWDADYPYNFWGNVPSDVGSSRAVIPHGGKGMLGMIYTNAATQSGQWFEYITGELSQPLTPGKSYLVSFYARIDQSEPGRNFKVGALLTTDKQISSNQYALAQVPDIALPQDSPLLETKSWRLVCGVIKAVKPHLFITIGNFGDGRLYDDLTATRHLMLIDDVFVGEIPDSLASSINVDDQPFDFSQTNKSSVKLEVFPNPAKDKLTVRSQIIFNDLSGRAVWRSEIFPLSVRETEINLQNIPVGFYTVTLSGDSKRASTKLIIAR